MAIDNGVHCKFVAGPCSFRRGILEVVSGAVASTGNFATTLLLLSFSVLLGAAVLPLLLPCMLQATPGG